MACSVFETPFGYVGVAASERGITSVVLPWPDGAETMRRLEEHEIDVEHRRARHAGRGAERPAADGGERLVARATDLLRRYFDGQRVELDLPLDTSFLTPFERLVSEEVRRIGYGEVSSYGDVASRVGAPRAARAVGGVMRRNNHAIFVPCHRVLGSSGLGGFGNRLDLKKALLRLEGAPLRPPAAARRPGRGGDAGRGRANG